MLSYDLSANLTCRVRRLFTIASLLQILINVQFWTIWYFTSWENINKMQKIQERALRFVPKDSTSDYEHLLSKCGVDSFRISSLKPMAVEIYKILNGMCPEYLSLFSESSIPYSLRDNNKLIKKKTRMITFGIKSFFSYYGVHLCQSK